MALVVESKLFRASDVLKQPSLGTVLVCYIRATNLQVGIFGRTVLTLVSGLKEGVRLRKPDKRNQTIGHGKH